MRVKDGKSGSKKNSAVRPQSKATAIPIPCGFAPGSAAASAFDVDVTVSFINRSLCVYYSAVHRYEATWRGPGRACCSPCTSILTNLALECSSAGYILTDAQGSDFASISVTAGTSRPARCGWR